MSDNLAIKGIFQEIDTPVRKISSVDLKQDPNTAVGMGEMPYAAYLSFGPLVAFIKEKVILKKGLQNSPLYHGFKQLLESAPELLGKIEDLSILDKYKDLVDLMITKVIPPVAQDTELAKLSKPFSMNAFYETDAVKALMNNHAVSYELDGSQDMLYCASIISSGSLILNQFYGQNLKISPPIMINVTEEGEEGIKHFKMQMDTTFVEVIPTGPLKPLTQDQINRLLSNIYDTDAWLEAMPPDAFEFLGFVKVQMNDITEEESLSRLKQALLQRNAIVNYENIRKLEQLIQTYLDVPGLQLGITAIDYPRERTIAHKYKIRFNLLANEVESLLDINHGHSIYEKACHYKEVLLVEDLTSRESLSPLGQKLLDKGIKSIMLAPLLNKNQHVIGLLEIGAPDPYSLHSFVELKFREITSLFSIAIERSRREIDNQVEAIIREQFTDIHPSVEWRFIQASYNLLEQREQNAGHTTVEPIVFNDVYPLYGQSDIVGSSQTRNQAIRDDLLENLQLARKVLVKISQELTFPLINKYVMNVDHAVKDLEEEFNSNDESRVVDLLQLSIHPALRMLQKQHPDLGAYIENYFLGLDEHLGIIYKERKDYEDTVSIINNAIGDYLDKQNKISQKILPHFYTKYKTDGVEYNLYFGKSILRNGDFCDMHLHNFRLQQLIDMSNVTRLVRGLQDVLPKKLTTAQLVFAYTNTLSIRFREDEKQFDVDGAYNVRYEILKKRIDKALIAGTDERLTQAGKVAIVYLGDKDRQEYMEYCQFLQHEGYVQGEIEDVALGKLQGAQGLRALRFEVS